MMFDDSDEDDDLINQIDFGGNNNDENTKTNDIKTSTSKLNSHIKSINNINISAQSSTRNSYISTQNHQEPSLLKKKNSDHKINNNENINSNNENNSNDFDRNKVNNSQSKLDKINSDGKNNNNSYDNNSSSKNIMTGANTQNENLLQTNLSINPSSKVSSVESVARIGVVMSVQTDGNDDKGSSEKLKSHLVLSSDDLCLGNRDTVDLDNLHDALEDMMPNNEEISREESAKRMKTYMKEISLKRQETSLISVINPEKLGDSLSSYIVYEIIREQQGSCAKRRYSEFLHLRKVLLAKYPGIIVPLPPEKNAIGRFEATFVETRRQELQQFLLWIALDPVLSTCEPFNLFCTSKMIYNSDLISDETKYTELLSDSITFKSSTTITVDERFNGQENQINKLDAILRSIMKVYQHFINTEVELDKSQIHEGEVWQQMKNEEVEKLELVFDSLFNANAELSKLNKDFIESGVQQMVSAIKYLIAINAAAMEQLANRKKALQHLAVAKSHLEKERLREAKGKEQNRLDKLQQLAVNTVAASARVDGIQEYLEDFQNTLLKHLQKLSDFRSSHLSLNLVEMLKKMIQLQRERVEVWENSLDLIEGKKTDLNQSLISSTSEVNLNVSGFIK